jgi:hypothetical protein
MREKNGGRYGKPGLRNSQGNSRLRNNSNSTRNQSSQYGSSRNNRLKGNLQQPGGNNSYSTMEDSNMGYISNHGSVAPNNNSRSSRQQYSRYADNRGGVYGNIGSYYDTELETYSGGRHGTGSYGNDYTHYRSNSDYNNQDKRSAGGGSYGYNKDRYEGSTRYTRPSSQAMSGEYAEYDEYDEIDDSADFDDPYENDNMEYAYDDFDEYNDRYNDDRYDNEEIEEEEEEEEQSYFQQSNSPRNYTQNRFQTNRSAYNRGNGWRTYNEENEPAQFISSAYGTNYDNGSRSLQNQRNLWSTNRNSVRPRSTFGNSRTISKSRSKNK